MKWWEDKLIPKISLNLFYKPANIGFQFKSSKKYK